MAEHLLPVYADDATFLWRAILVIAIHFVAVDIATSRWALNDRIFSANDDKLGNEYNGDSDYHFEDFSTLPWTFIILGLSVIWNIPKLAILPARNRPIHPGTNVGCDLCCG